MIAIVAGEAAEANNVINMQIQCDVEDLIKCPSRWKHRYLD